METQAPKLCADGCAASTADEIKEPENDNASFDAWRRSLTVDPAILNREVEIAFGRNREDKYFKTKTLTLLSLLEHLMLVRDQATGPQRVGWARGDKDGECILQGGLIAGQRGAKNVRSNHIVMVDYDTGYSIGEIATAIRKLGFFALLWTTHSHLKPETLIAEERLVKWAAGRGIDVALASTYLAEVKGYKPEIAASVSAIERFHADGGMKFKLVHAPMPRVRALFVLAEPFDFAKGGTQGERIVEWKERYAGLCQSLNLPWDRSCCDPSRLMYTPRIAKDADERKHEYMIVDGRTLSLGDMPRVPVEKPRASSSSTFVGDDAPDDKFQTQGMQMFLRDDAWDFQAATWMEEMEPDGVRRDQGEDKKDFVCPNEDAHSEIRSDDTAFMVENASGRDGGFYMGCLHDGCKAASGGDRGWYLDKACEKYGIKHADDLKKWCPNAGKEGEEDGIGEQAAAASRNKSGRDWVKRKRVPPETMAVLEDMNERHAFIVYGGRSRYLAVTPNPKEFELPYQFLDNQTFENLNKDTPDVKLAGGFRAVYKPRAWVWNNWPGRRKYTRIGFYPNQDAPDGAFNFWEGWRHALKKGSWKRTLKHIYEVICCRDPEKFRYLIDHLSHVLQTTGQPEKRSPVSPFIWGDPGSGKSIVFDHMAKIFGNHGLTLSKPEELTGSFNKHLMLGLYVVCEEAVYGKDRQAAAVLKDILTRRTMNVHPKGVDMFTSPNFMRFVFIGNGPDQVPMTIGERRYEVFHVSPHRIDDDTWFDRIVEELNEEGGLEAMMHDLLHRKYDEKLVRRLMKENEDRDTSKARMLDPPIRFALEWIAHGAIMLRNHTDLASTCKPSPKDAASNATSDFQFAAASYQGCLRLQEHTNLASSADVKTAYDGWCEIHLNQFERRTCQRATNQLTKEIRKALTFIGKYQTNAERGIKLPPRKECLEKVKMLPIEWAYIKNMDADEDGD